MANSNASKLNWEIPTKPFIPDYNYRNYVLNMDFYELSMAEAYFNLGLQDVKGTFDIFFRKNPAPKSKNVQARERMQILMDIANKT